MSDTLKDDPLTTLGRLLKEATPGSVYVSYDEDGFPVIHLDENDENEDSYEPVARFTSGVSKDRHDAALYAHLRNLAPALVEVVKAAREDLAARNTGDPDWNLAREARANNALVAALRALEVKK